MSEDSSARSTIKKFLKVVPSFFPEKERDEARIERLERRRSSLDEHEIESMLSRICEDEENFGYIQDFVHRKSVLLPPRPTP